MFLPVLCSINIHLPTATLSGLTLSSSSGILNMNYQLKGEQNVTE